ncbi:myo-inosose-2 dehydratase [Brevibacillus fulvus]|uniref:Inosose dehydratase n=1 Tax=Brevibacillus fulvus TaxID=1125967 RepID=A0A939BT74_9BACL|nr:myo-inosose-2 dehydratase [Brevibacillus fulvus]MBM7589189.1 inosose dehydratase [Brevibacillus fulvus]
MATVQETNEQFRIGIAPISWVNDDIPGLGDHYTQDQVLREMASLGYRSTEMGRLFSQEPAALREKLAAHGLQLASKFVGVLLSDRDRQQAELDSFREWAEYLKEMGCRHVIVCEMGGSIHWDPRRSPQETGIRKLTDEQWQTLVDGLHQAAGIAQALGLELVYHYHAGTVVETAEEIDRLMAETAPGLVHLLFDTGHALYGGYDPLALWMKYEKRIKYVHLKDVRAEVLKHVRMHQLDFRSAVLQGLFTVPGDGCIDFVPIFRRLLQSQYAGWVIVEAEQDPAVADPYTYAKMAKDYIEQTLKNVGEEIRLPRQGERG